MRIRHIVWKELWHRKLSALIVLGAVALSVGLVVLIQRVQITSQEELRLAMDAMGKNIVILPRDVPLDRYLAGNLGAETLPQMYVGMASKPDPDSATDAVVAGRFQGSYQRRATILGERIILCGQTGETDATSPAAGAPPRQLERGEGELGIEAARRLGLEDLTTTRTLPIPFQAGRKKDAPVGPRPPWMRKSPLEKPTRGAQVSVQIRKIRKPTGTVRDFMVFVNIDVARDAFGEKRPVVNVIEALSVMCSKEMLPTIAKTLEDRFRGTEHEVRAYHLLAIAEARRRARAHKARNMDLLSIATLILGAFIIGGYSVMNVRGRRKEMGIMLAIAARPGHVVWMFLQKMIILSVIGGAVGCWLGSAAAMRWGPAIGAALQPPLWKVYGLALAFSLGLTLLPSLAGVVIASRIDPAETLREL